jgi:Flp pilus assembly protein CpaB
MRAFGVKVELEAAVGGLIQPGAEVDVIQVQNVEGKIVKNVVDKLRVLAVDAKVPEEKDKVLTFVVVLEVKPEEAQKLAEDGKLSLMLRRPSEIDKR